MKLLPDDPAQRRRLLLLAGGAVVLYLVLNQFAGTQEVVIPKTLGPAPTAAPRAQGRGITQAKRQVNTTPVPLKFAQIEQVPDEPDAGRNIFRFGVPPPPPQPKFTPLPPPPPPTPTIPPPPPIPPILLRLVTILNDDTVPGGKRAILTHLDTGAAFETYMGDRNPVDGRYKVLAIGTNDIVMSHLDGTGQRRIPVGGTGR